MDDRIMGVIEREFGDFVKIGVKYKDDNLVLYTFTDSFGDKIRAVPKATDKIDILWIYGPFDIYKLEGEDLATIRDQLVSVPKGFSLYNDKIILGNDMCYRDGVFLFISCSAKAFYLPNTKITVYEMPDEDMDEVKSPVIKIKQILDEEV